MGVGEGRSVSSEYVNGLPSFCESELDSSHSLPINPFPIPPLYILPLLPAPPPATYSPILPPFSPDTLLPRLYSHSIPPAFKAISPE